MDQPMVSTTLCCHRWFALLTIEQENDDAPVFDPTGQQYDFVSVPSPLTAVSVDAVHTVAFVRVYTDTKNSDQWLLIIEQGNYDPSTAPEEGQHDFVSASLPSLVATSTSLQGRSHHGYYELNASRGDPEYKT
jgi:hypothetical protein